MDPVISAAIAHVSIADLHHDATRRRLARQVSAARSRRLASGAVSPRTRLAEWLATRGRAVQQHCQPELVCCPV